ncbi:D-aminoacyl-tRNA deacylase [Algivirga pacifica]|uniref:D-aminoacyl-tRNA deacylase n=1 Tax=Algivirga pacifica TaxID=1162670 RepID=A0ABP9DH27_9BACT
MIAVIQRVGKSQVSIDGEVVGRVDKGLNVLLGVGHEDTAEDVQWLANKIVNMRIFGDEEDKMNLSIKDVGGDILLISQFTLHASTKKGNRPSYIDAAKPDRAIPLYEQMKDTLEELLGRKVETGEFGADMQVEIMNDGPVTILVDTKNKR